MLDLNDVYVVKEVYKCVVFLSSWWYDWNFDY